MQPSDTEELGPMLEFAIQQKILLLSDTQEVQVSNQNLGVSRAIFSLEKQKFALKGNKFQFGHLENLYL